MAAMAKAALLFIATIYAFTPNIKPPVKKHAPLFAKPTEVHYALNAELSKEQSPAKLVALVEERSQDFNGVNMATALRRLATAPLGRQPRARAAGLVAARLETSLAERPDDFDARSVATACWAFAKLGLGVPGALARAAAGLAARMEPRELATTAWALATAARDADAAADGGYAAASAGETEAALKAAADGAKRRAKALSGRDASTVVFALATAKVEGRSDCYAALARRLGGPAVAGAGSWNGQDVANAAWAYASAREPAPRLFGAFSAFAAANASRLSPQGVATLAWAFATQRRCPRGTGVAGDRPSQDAAAFSALAARGAAVSRELDARSLALLSWAFAASRRGGRSLAPRGEDTLFEALEAHAIPRLARGLGARDSAALAWSLATVGRACRPAFEAVAAGAARVPAAQWSPQALANVLWAFATQRSGYGPGRLFDALEPAVVAKADALASRDVATVLWAYAARRRLSEAPRPDAVFGAVARSPGLAARLRGASPQSLANVAWAVAALYADGGGLDDAGRALGLDAVLAAVADAAVPVARAGRFEARQLATLARAFAAVRADAPEPTLLGALGRAAAADARALSPLDAAMVADAASRCRAFVGNADAVVAALADDAADRASAFDAQEREDLCRALAVCGFADHALFGAAAEAVFPRVADDAKLLPVPTTAYAANDTDRVTVLEVVPYDAMFLAPLGSGPGSDAGAPRRDDPIRELYVPPQDADVASL